MSIHLSGKGIALLILSLIIASPALAGPTDPVAYYQELTRADRLLTDRDYAGAVDIYQILCQDYPEDGRTWRRLAQCRYSLKQYAEAAEAYQAAGEWGVTFPANVYFNAACSYALIGETERAFTMLEKAMEVGWENRVWLTEDSDLESLHDDPRWVELAGVLPPGREFTRDEGWRYDLEFLAREIDRLHPDPHTVHTGEEFAAAIAALHRRIPDLSDEQIWVEMQKIVVMLGDGHSGIRPTEKSRITFSKLPVQLYLFSDGLFVIDADDENLIGTRVVSLGGESSEALIRASESVIPRDNQMGIRSLAPFILTLPALLENLGADVDDGTVSVTVENLSGEVLTVALSAVDINPGHSHGLGRGLNTSWLGDRDDLPLYMARGNENYWYQRLPEADAVFLQFNTVRNQQDVSLAEFAENLRRDLASNPAGNVIVDIRLNGGGNSFLYPPLIRTLIEFEAQDEGNTIYVITGRQTFSAAQNFATDLDNWTDAVFAGEPTGSRPNMIGESTEAVLPYSRMHLGISSRYHQQSFPGDDRPYIAPRIPVTLTSEDYFAMKDPVLEAVLGVIKAGKERAGD